MRELAARPENQARRPRIVLQAWIDCAVDDIWCVETLYRRGGRPVGFLSLRKVRTNVNRDGTFGSRMYAGEAVSNPPLEALAEELLTHLGWQGFAHLDWMRSPADGRFYLTEINPRLPGFSTVLAKAGFDLAWLYYADLEGLPVEPARPRRTLYFEPFRYPGDLSSAAATIARGQYSAWAFFASYARMLRGAHRVALEFFSWRDPGMTLAVMLGMARTVLRNECSQQPSTSSDKNLAYEERKIRKRAVRCFLSFRCNCCGVLIDSRRIERFAYRKHNQI